MAKIKVFDSHGDEIGRQAVEENVLIEMAIASRFPGAFLVALYSDDDMDCSLVASKNDDWRVRFNMA